MLVRVKNIQNTADRAPSGFASWREYWCKKSGKPWPTYCCAQGCFKLAEVGGHVKKVGSSDNRWYIVPLCYTHNNDHDAEFVVPDDMLVPVNL